MNIIANQKQKIRKKLLNIRENFDSFSYKEADEIICKNVMELIDHIKINYEKSIVKTIGFYWPLKGEPDLFKIILMKNYQFALPRVEDSNMSFVKYNAGDAIEKSNFQELYYPSLKYPIIPQIIIIPGLAFSIQGYRLGFGKGHYDRYLARQEHAKIITIGVTYHETLFEYLPYAENDHKLDYIITNNVVIKL